MQLTGGTVRKLIPAAAVAAVLAASFLAQPSLASSTNNCGVKGYGYHDHGKPCPNRPFPGHGKGVIRIAAQAGTILEANSNPGDDEEKTANASTSTSSDQETESSASSETGGATSHGHGHGHTKSHGHQGA